MTGHVRELTSDEGWTGRLVRYGHWGRPVLAFPAEAGSAWDFADHGMVEALSPLIDAGRISLFCVDSADGATWSERSIPLEERARGHDAYERWVLNQVVPAIHSDLGGPQAILTMGTSLGAFHAVNMALRHAQVFPVGLGLSGSYDPSRWHAWGDRGDTAYFHNPTDYVPRLDGDHLRWLRTAVHIVLVVGEGAFEVHPTGALPSTRELAGLLAERGVPCDLDVWGPDTPHDWSAWQRQALHHLTRFS